MPADHAIPRLAPGIAVALAVALLGEALHAAQVRAGHLVLDALVLAILLGMAIRSVRPLPDGWAPGIAFSAKTLLEIAIVLLGASVDFREVARGGPMLVAGIGITVAVTLVIGAWIGRLAGLEPKHALLVAFGNAICGNSAIAALAPVIGARREHVASAIAFTAVLGVLVVVGLPFLVPLAHLSDYQYGVVAGLTVYAVPQVLAAAFPVSALSGQVGTLVKLVRVLFLGPVLVGFSLMARRDERRAPGAAAPRFELLTLLPWFVIGFVLLSVLRTVGVLPAAEAAPLRTAAHWLTLVAMAALGLGVNVRELRHVGRPVVLTVMASLLLLLTLSLAVAKFAGH
ncbi:MAG TPA: putative sulfate exporter family transporter [Gemmatimonadales bacterium]|nr:putative sulfate exporter family transporter [Gemmatimonadales bacterium]